MVTAMPWSDLDTDYHVWDLVAEQGYEDIADVVHPRDKTKRRKSTSNPSKSLPKKPPTEECRSPFTKKKGCTEILRNDYDQDILWDMLVFEGFLNNPDWELYVPLAAADASMRLTHADGRGDVITILNIVRAWCKQPDFKAKSAWCAKHGFTNKIRQVSNYVKSRLRTLSDLGLDVNSNGYPAKELCVATVISESIRLCGANLAIYRGHPSLGYKIIKTGRIVHLHELSSLNLLTRPSQFIVIMDDTFETRNVVRYAFAVTYEEAQTIYIKNNLGQNFEEALEVSTYSPVTFHLGIGILNIVKENLSYLKEELAEVCGDRVMIEIERHKLVVYCLRKDQRDVKGYVMQFTNTVADAVPKSGVEVPFPRSGGSIRVVVTDGWVVDNVLLPWQQRSVHIMELKRSHLSAEYVKCRLDQFGEILMVKEYPAETKDELKRWGFATFASHTSVHKLIESDFRDDLMCCESETAREIIDTSQHTDRAFVRNDVQTMRVTSHIREKRGWSGMTNFVKKLRQVLDGSVDTKTICFVPMVASLESHLSVELRFDGCRAAASSREILSCTKYCGEPILVSPLNGHGAFRISWRLHEKLCKVVSNFLHSSDFRIRINRVNLTWPNTAISGELFCIESAEIETIIQASNIITEIMFTPTVYKVPPRWDSFSLDTLSFEKVMESSKTFIDLNPAKSYLRIYGLRRNVRKATKDLDGIINGDTSIDLHDERLSSNIMIKLASDFGLELTGLAQKCRADSLVLDIVHRRLDFGENIESKDRILEYLRNNYGNHEMTAEIRNRETGDECQTCFTPLSEHLNNVCLLTCGHSYCLECIHTQIDVSLETKAFPISCVSCNVPIPLQTLSGLCIFFGGRNKLTRAAVSSFTTHDSNIIGFCHTLDCNGIVHVSKTRNGAELKCVLCSTRQCPDCRYDYHPDMSCDEFMGDIGLDIWLNADPDRRRCPNCSQPIEKEGGCNHVQCRSCSSHLCWVCMRYFDNRKSCYNHLNYDHGGYNWLGPSVSDWARTGLHWKQKVVNLTTLSSLVAP